jgi:fatty-acyl-CoA synthase
MYPGTRAAADREKPALIMGASGAVVTFGELDDRSNQLAQLMWAAGLRPGDHLAVFLENHLVYPEVAWAALRSGLYVTAVNRYLTAEEAGYIVNDCGARVLVSSAALADRATAVLEHAPDIEVALMVDGVAEGFTAYFEALSAFPASPLDDEPLGELMLYSSGTTGRPKGIRRPLSGRQAAEGDPLTLPVLSSIFGMDDRTVYLSPAPMYHSAPLGFSLGVQAFGGTVVMMERFDPVEALRLIERHRVTHSQWVPTMFVRMLKLPAADRDGYDLSSHTTAIHGAAPCPVPVKEQMIEWWGPIIREYYGATEGNGFCHIHSAEWLEHKGSVGKSLLGAVHICDDDGKELPTGDAGLMYFERPEMPFEYHNDTARTRDAQHPEHPNWSTLGDVGYVDEDGYVYITDRKSFMIISGGVNIYPQEIEDVLIMHPAVLDAAVIGVPHEEFGEEVKAVVQPVDGAAGDDLERDLLAYCRDRLATFKVPRSVDFVDELPRLPTGKLYKRLLRERYWAGRQSTII